MQITDIYYLIAGIAYGIFIVKFILSLVVGDTDVDIDGDAESDFDMSSLFSFKGLVHFCMGCFGWLAGKEYFTHDLQAYDAIIAIIIGNLFVFILYWVYKLCSKFQHIPSNPYNYIGQCPERMFGRKGRVRYVDQTDGLVYCNFSSCGEVILVVCESTSETPVHSGQTVIIKGYNNETSHYQI